MREDKSDTHDICQSIVINGEQLSTLLTQRYSLTKPLQEMTIHEFLEIAIWRDCKMKLKIQPGNNNTACPTYTASPNGTLELYISNEQTRCGRIQLLYWYFNQLYNNSSFAPDSEPPLFLIEGGTITSNTPTPLNVEMDENDISMHFAKLMIKIFR